MLTLHVMTEAKKGAAGTRPAAGFFTEFSVHPVASRRGQFVIDAEGVILPIR